jgi:hypothetical protein
MDAFPRRAALDIRDVAVECYRSSENELEIQGWRP